MVHVSTLVQCPLDRSHIMKSERIQYHLVRCLKNYRGTKVRCPFNAIEYFEPHELQDHILTCEKRRPIERHLFESQNPKGTFAAPYLHDGPTSDEAWGLDPPTPLQPFVINNFQGFHHCSLENQASVSRMEGQASPSSMENRAPRSHHSSTGSQGSRHGSMDYKGRGSQRCSTDNEGLGSRRSSMDYKGQGSHKSMDYTGQRSHKSMDYRGQGSHNPMDYRGRGYSSMEESGSEVGRDTDYQADVSDYF